MRNLINYFLTTFLLVKLFFLGDTKTSKYNMWTFRNFRYLTWCMSTNSWVLPLCCLWLWRNLVVKISKTRRVTMEDNTKSFFLFFYPSPQLLNVVMDCDGAVTGATPHVVCFVCLNAKMQKTNTGDVGR